MQIRVVECRSTRVSEAVIIPALRRLYQRTTDRTRLVNVSSCYHYRAFRYGGFGNNPYEDFVLGLARDDDPRNLRSAFANAILQCRPVTFDEAFQIDVNEKPLWAYPWAKPKVSAISIESASENPDIVCHVSTQGVLASHLNREFRWLSSAFESISANGYLPEHFGYIRVQELTGETCSSYLVLDGNHRLSALHALGVSEVLVKVIRSRIARVKAAHWEGVIDGRFQKSEALDLFDCYFRRTNPVIGTLRPAVLIEDEPLELS